MGSRNPSTLNDYPDFTSLLNHRVRPVKMDRLPTAGPAPKANGMGTWKRYKLGQAQFQSWLKQTAEKLTRKKANGESSGTANGGPVGDGAPGSSREPLKRLGGRRSPAGTARAAARISKPEKGQGQGQGQGEA